MAFTGVVVGMAAEAACLTVLGASVRVARSGARPRLARAGAQSLVEDGASALVSFGIAGALVPGLAPGTLVVPETVVVTGGGSSLTTDTGWRDRIAMRLGLPAGGCLLGSDTAVTSAKAKADLAAATGACAVDMESHIVGAVARDLGVPFLVLRAVADPADRSIPPPALAGLDENGETRPLAVALHMMIQPWTLPALLRLASDSKAGLAALAAAVSRLGPSAFGPG